MGKLVLGSAGDSFSARSVKAYLAEFAATFFAVFAGVWSLLAFAKVTAGATLGLAGLVALTLAQLFIITVVVFVASRISGGHLNPVVTFVLAIWGQITILTGLLYWVVQLLGTIVAWLILSFVTGGLVVPIVPEMAAKESVITWALVYSVYATVEHPKNGLHGIITPIAMGLMVGPNIFAANVISRRLV